MRSLIFVMIDALLRCSCGNSWTDFLLYLPFFLMTYSTSVFKINIFYCLVLPCSSWQNPQSWFQSTKFGSIPELRSDPFFSLFMTIQNHWLVVSTPLKIISWDYYSQYMEKKSSKPPTRLITCKSKTLFLGGIRNFSSFTKHPNCSVRPGAAATGAMPQRRHAQRRFFTADGRAGAAPGEQRLTGTAGRCHLRSK